MQLWQSKYNPQYKLSQQDLLDISHKITEKYAPHDNPHQSELVLMPVDPVNLYAYWHLNDSETSHKNDSADKQLALRIYSLPELSEQPGNMQLRFDIIVHGTQNQQKVPLPVAAMAYSAVIGEINADNSFNALATSESIHVPRETPVSEINENTPLTNQMIEEHTDTPPALPGTQSNSNALEKAKHTSLALQSDFNTLISNDTSLPETHVLKNFNEYGYDLIVYGGSLDSEFMHTLPNPINDSQVSTNNKEATHCNTSGQRLNI